MSVLHKGRGADAIRVSVVMPAYKTAGTIARSIESVLAQTHPVHELLVVDDGSPDNCAEVVAAFGGPVRVIRQANAGVSAARNRGVAEATGDCIAFLDSDDTWRPERLARGVALLRRDPALAWAATAYEVLEAGGRRRVRDAAGAAGLLQADGTFRDFYKAAHAGAAFHTITMLIRREVFAHAGGFDTDLRAGEDVELWHRIARSFPRIGYVAEVSAAYDCTGAESLTRGRRCMSGQLWKMLTRLARPGSAPAGGRVSTARDMLIAREVRDATLHALRLGETEQVARLLREYRAWMSTRVVVAATLAKLLTARQLAGMGEAYRTATRYGGVAGGTAALLTVLAEI